MGTTNPTSEHILTLACPDGPGIVFAVAGFLAERGCNIVQSQQFDDRESETFFMRVQFVALAEKFADLARLRAEFGPIATSLRMNWRMVNAAAKPKVLIMVSKFGHCLNDLLFRTSIGGLNIEVVSVVSNHPTFANLVGGYGIPFRHIPVTEDTKPGAEAELLDLVRERDVDLVVLARYMQVLSDDLCKQLEGWAINIHHSMLPSFKGARPYHQAYARGVKIVGATAHYVTSDLDEGPIIEQEVARVDHAMGADEVTALGRDVECQALARAVRWHTENRVLLNGDRTVVLH